MKNLPLGIQTFSEIIKNNYLYVDKTKDIFNLVNKSGKYHFISRPRRFGKSLLVTTLKEIFLGNKELFKDLWIYDKIEWNKYPVIHIDFSGLSLLDSEDFKRSFENKIIWFLKENNIEINPNYNYKENFTKLLQELSKIEKVVILIDEYDKPITNFIDSPEIVEKNRNILKNFYETIKENDKYIKFAFLTGVSKFSKVSVFSGLNNLRDITLSDSFSTLLGYTQQELENYFSEYLEVTKEKFNLSKEILLKELKNWYNGYSWNGKNFVYNPYSILSFFIEKEFNNYWFSTGTPTFLIKIIKEYDINIPSLENYETDNSIFDSFDINNMNVQSLLFQTGYLTIKSITNLTLGINDYILSYPNTEVRESLLKNLLANLSSKNGEIGVLINKMVRSLLKNDIGSFFNYIKSLFSSIPSHIFIKDKEAYYHTIIYLILTLIGVRIQAEVHTNKGRIDSVIETAKNIYIIEFKLGKAEKALEQIEEMKYHEKFINSKKEIILIGVGFSIKDKNIDNYIIKNLI